MGKIRPARLGLASIQAAQQDATRPTRELLRQIWKLTPLCSDGRHAEVVDSTVLEEIGRRAEVSMRTIQLGLGALGHLLARCSPEILDGTVPPECVENLGYLMAELGDFAAECMRLASECRCAGNQSSGREGKCDP
jgi:hypothetical protein